MTWFARSCTIAIVLLVASAAHARELGVISTGGDIIPLRDLPPETAAPVEFTSLGYHYDVIGIFWLDIWRWGGEFVVYTSDTDVSSRDASDAAGGSLVLERWAYAPITSEQLERLGGADVPWKYHCPPGLLVILALVELQLVVRRRRSARTVLVIGGALLVTALVLYGHGVDQAFVIPLLLGLHHAGAAWLAIRRQRDDNTSGDDAANEPHVTPAAPREASRASRQRERPPNVETDPFRAPPQPAPIVVERPPTPPSATSVVAEADAPPPKLLR